MDLDERSRRCAGARRPRSASPRSRAPPAATSTSAHARGSAGDPRRRRHRGAAHDHGRRHRPALLAVRRAHPQGPAQRRSAASASQYDGRGEQANAGWHYLNPSLVGAHAAVRRAAPTTTQLLQRFVVASTQARHRRRRAPRRPRPARRPAGHDARRDRPRARLAGLGDRQLPPFMRRANTTFVNLRATLDDLDPLVEESKPVRRSGCARAAPSCAPFAIDARPTVRDLADARARGPGERQRPDRPRRARSCRSATSRSGPVRRNGKERRGLVRRVRRVAASQTPHWAFQRPYVGRPDRLVRRLQPLRHLRRQRLRRAAWPRACHAFRVLNGLVPTLEFVDPAELRAAIFRAGRHARPEQPLPRLDRARPAATARCRSSRRRTTTATRPRVPLGP